jgi:hypothetical protein
LSVRQSPSLSSSSNPSGGVASGATIRLANPIQSQTNSAEGNRVWVRIVSPRTGWFLLDLVPLLLEMLGRDLLAASVSTFFSLADAF